jgi:hypothetical protein
MIVFDTISETRASKSREFPDNPNQLGGGRVARGTDNIGSFNLPGEKNYWYKLLVDVPATLRAHFRI